MTSTPKLLVVHADPHVGRALQQAFCARGWEVVCAFNSVAMVDAARREQPNAIVLSSRLSGGGTAALRRLRLLVHTTWIPVVVLVASDDERHELLRAGAQAAIASPPDVDALVALVADQAGSPLPVTEAPEEVLRRPERLAALEQTGLRAQPTDQVLDALTALAASLLGVPVALATLVDHDRQRFAGQVGLATRWATERQTPLTHSFCQWVVAADEPLAVSDARTHPSLRTNAAIQDLGVVAYAGMPMQAAGGEALGSFCAIDAQPRAWKEEDFSILGDLATIAEAHIGSRAPIAATMPGAERRLRAEKTADAVRAVGRVLRRRHAALTDDARAQLLDLLDRQGEQLGRLLRGAS